VTAEEAYELTTEGGATDFARLIRACQEYGPASPFIAYGLEIEGATTQLRKFLAWIDPNERITPIAADYRATATIKAGARKPGSVLELPDCLIAAVAARFGRPLVTGNPEGFSSHPENRGQSHPGQLAERRVNPRPALASHSPRTSQVRVRLYAAPQVPACHRAVGTPLLRQALDFRRHGDLRHPIGLADRVADAQVSSRQHIRPPQAKIRNMCTVHSPIPFTWVSRSITAWSGSSVSSSNTTRPSRVCRAKSRM